MVLGPEQVTWTTIFHNYLHEVIGDKFPGVTNGEHVTGSSGEHVRGRSSGEHVIGAGMCIDNRTV